MIVPDAVRELLSRHEALFPTGSIAELATDYLNPVAVFLPDGLRVEHTTADTVAAVCRLQEVARAAGMVSVHHAILGARAIRAGRVTLLVGWDFRDVTGNSIAESRVKYFLARQSSGAYMIEMLEIEQHAFPDQDPTILTQVGV